MSVDRVKDNRLTSVCLYDVDEHKNPNYYFTKLSSRIIVNLRNKINIVNVSTKKKVYLKESTYLYIGCESHIVCRVPDVASWPRVAHV